jgi:hypothetical protein
MIKRCNDCGGEFDKGKMFNKKSAGRCIPCYKLSRKKKYMDNLEERRETARNNYRKLTDDQKKRMKDTRSLYIEKTKDKKLEYNRNWYHKNKLRLKSEGRCWNDNNKEKRQKQRKIREANPETKARLDNYRKDYIEKNKEAIRERERLWLSIPKNKIARSLRHRVRGALMASINGKIIKKIDSNRNLLGISFSELKTYLENLFLEGMSWDNYGEWQIDHIIPCSFFDLTIEENQRICFNYKNLQPMWRTDNQSKGDKIVIANLEEFLSKIKES